MVHAGEGYKFHVTGLTHDERGYPNMTPRRRTGWCAGCRTSSRPFRPASRIFEAEGIEDAEVVVVSYGITSRVAQRAIEMARRARDSKVGKFRMISAWPFPEKRIREIAARVKAFVVPELNLGQMVREVERAAAGVARTYLRAPRGRQRARPEDILKAIVEASR